MKILISIILLTISSLTFANPHHHTGPRHWNHYGHNHWHNKHHGHHRNNWILPALVGGAVVYAATRPTPIIIQPPILSNPNEIIIDGVVYTRQRMYINGIEQEVLVRIQ